MAALSRLSLQVQVRARRAQLSPFAERRREARARRDAERAQLAHLVAMYCTRVALEEQAMRRLHELQVQLATERDFPVVSVH